MLEMLQCLILNEPFLSMNLTDFSDLYVSQAGPGTIAEALIRGLPIVLNDYIPGQVSHQHSALSLNLTN